MTGGNSAACLRLVQWLLRRFAVNDEVERRIPVIEERARVDKQIVERAVVRISTSIKQSEQVIAESLRHEEVDIQRVPVNKEVDSMPSVRQEGDVVVIPVVEERAVLVKRLVLVEELHVHRHVVEAIVETPVSLRSTEVSIERQGSPPGEQT
jgi:uncharacterized protein (TIGR02271 family)